MKFEMGDRVYCIKEYETLKVYELYRITGSGDLTMYAKTNKSGYGFMIEDENYAYFSGIKEDWKLPYEKRVKFYYFTEEEMSDYFVKTEDELISYKRDKKLKKLLK